MTPDEMRDRIARAEALLARRMHLRPRPMPALLDAAGARLPPRARRHAGEAAEARGRLDHPAAAARSDAAWVRDACAGLERALGAVPEGGMRRADWRRALATAGLRASLVALAAADVALWRGHS